jgi:hypothetical protein
LNLVEYEDCDEAVPDLLPLNKDTTSAKANISETKESSERGENHSEDETEETTGESDEEGDSQTDENFGGIIAFIGKSETNTAPNSDVASLNLAPVDNDPSKPD